MIFRKLVIIRYLTGCSGRRISAATTQIINRRIIRHNGLIILDSCPIIFCHDINNDTFPRSTFESRIKLTLLSKYFAVLASAERIIELDNIPDEIEENEYDINVEYFYDKLQTIKFDNITFRYDRDVILDNTSLTVNKGDFVAIMGISGIGKSTLLKLLLGVFHVEDGEIWLNTSEGDVKVDCHTRRLFTFVPQGNFLLSGTIRENLTFINSDATEDEINEAVRIACADKFLDELPDGLETVIGERGIGLSEGQLQRLAIARAILSKSPIMLLDEATSALDEETELEFLRNLRQMQNKTCIIVSHKKAALEICNKHIQIVDGKIVLEEKQ